MNLEQKTKKFIIKHHMISPKDGILVGLSGGADSVALLEVLCSLRAGMELKLAALHVHHGIRKEAQEDADFCRTLCQARGVDFYCEYADVPGMAKTEGMTLEEAGRKKRYELFEVYRQKLGLTLIAVAHHQKDQAETMLFQLFRGSGLRGLAGIPVKRGAVIRPLLCVGREEIEGYLAERQTEYVTDATNFTEMYARNKIRLQVLPVAEEISAGAAEHMSRTGAQLREVLEFMEQEAERFLEHNGWNPSERLLSVSALQDVHPALQKMIILAVVEKVFDSRKDITEKHVEGILQLWNKDGEKAVYLPKGGRVIKRYDNLVFENGYTAEEEALVSAPIEIGTDTELLLPDGKTLKTGLFLNNNLENIPKSDCIKWFDYDRIEKCLVLRTREKGDFLIVNDQGSRKTLQDYFVNEKVPRSERDKLLVLADGHHIVWVPGMRISAYYKVTKETRRILQVYIGGKQHGRESGSFNQ